jgi:N4-gp56 family major capsid protein
MPVSSNSAIAPSTVGVSPTLRLFLEKKLLERLVPVFTHAMDGYTRGIPSDNGKTISFRRRNHLNPTTASAYALTEGVTPSALTPSTDEIQITPLQYGGWIDAYDVAEAISYDPLMQADIEDLGDFNGQVLDISVRESIVTGTNVVRAAGRTSRITVAAGDVIDDATMKKAVAFLTNKNAPRFSDGYYHGIFPALAIYDLFGTDAYKFPSYYQNQSDMKKGKVSELWGVKFMFTSLAKIFTGTGASGIDVACGLIYGPGAYGTPNIPALDQKVIIKAIGSSGSADALDQRGSRGTKATMGSAILDQSKIIRVEFALGYSG